MNEIQLTQKLVRINSENPPDNEEEIAKFIFNYLKSIGLKPKIFKVGEKKYDVVAGIGSGKGGLMLNGHMDTVPIGEGWNGLSGKINNGKIYGRGSSDMKSGIAAIITAAKNILKEKPKFNRKLLLTFVASEETINLGSEYLIKRKRSLLTDIKYAAVGECTGLSAMKGQKGVADIKIKFKGKSCHGSRPEQGKSAILNANRFINEYQKIKFKKGKLGKSTFNIGVINGGTKINVVPDCCEMEIDRRLVDNETPETALREVKSLLKKLRLKSEVRMSAGRNPMTLPENSKMLKLFKSLGIELKIATGYNESEMYHSNLGIEAVSFGPGPRETAHTKNEFAIVNDIKKATKIYEKIIREICL